MSRSRLAWGVALVTLVALIHSPTTHAETINQNLYVTNGGVNATALSGGTLYIGGLFTSVGPASGSGVPVDATSGAALAPYDKVAGSVLACVSDGSGGWFIGGVFTAVGGVPRNNLAHILSDNTLDASWDPNVNGNVAALAVSGSTVYAGGSFTLVNGATARTRLAAFDASTGVATAWNPQASNTVNAIAVSGSTVYVGGSFGTVNGSTQRNRIAALDASTGTATSWDPNMSSNVNAIAVSGSTVYAGGAFTTVNGSTTRNRIAAIDASSGTATSWDPNCSSGVSAIAVNGSTVYVGGSFVLVNGATSRSRIAALDASTGTATSWDPSASGTVSAIAVNGSTVYLGGVFTTVNGSTTRNQAAAVDATTGVATAWNPNANSTVAALAVSGSTVYIGGAFTSLNGQSRTNLAALDPTTGQVLSWNPTVNGQVLALATDGAVVYAGGLFTLANGATPRNRIAAFSSSGTLSSWDPDASGQVNALAIDGSTVYAGGTFFTIGGQSRSRLAALDAGTGLATSWDPNPDGIVSALASSGGTVYAGGSFTTWRPPTGNGVPVDATSGLAVPGFPQVNGFVGRVASDGSGGWYIAGSFTQVGGVARNGLAHILANLTVDPSWDPNPNATVVSLEASGATVYVGGDFTSIGGQTRNRIAELDASGAATAWNPNSSNRVTTIAAGGSVVYAGFENGLANIGGQNRNGVVALDATTGLATSWQPNVFGIPSALAVSGGMVYVGGSFFSGGANNLAAYDTANGFLQSWLPNPDASVSDIVADGSTIYVAGSFTSIGGQTRLRIAAVDAGTGNATAWNPAANGSVFDLELNGGTMYAAGSFSSIGGQLRNNVAALDKTTGLASGWDPNTNNSVSEVALGGSNVYLGGNFTTLNPKVRNRIAQLDAATGGATAWNPNASGTVSALAVSGSTVYAGGSFATIGGQSRSFIAALDAGSGFATAWNPGANAAVSALAVTSTTLYAGGSFTTIGGQPRNFLAAVNALTGTVLPWNPSASAIVRSLARGATTVYAGGSFTSIGYRSQVGIAAIEDDPPPILTAVSPSSGGSSDPVTISFEGQRFSSAATAKLVRTGQPDIVGTGVTVTPDGLSLSALFDLGGRLEGAWDAVVTNPDLQSATLVGGFTIASVEAPQLHVSLVGTTLDAGNPVMRRDRRTPFDLVIENPGNVDAVSVPLWLAGIPTDATLALDFPLSYPAQAGGEPDWSAVPLSFTSAGGQYVPLVIPRVPPGTTTRRLYLTVPGPSHPPFTLTAAVTPPWANGNKFRSCIAPGGIGDVACMGTQLDAINAYLAANESQISAMSGVAIWAKQAWQCEGAASMSAALVEAEEVLDFLEGPVEGGGSAVGCEDVLPARWRETRTVTVVGSIDPNDKLGAQGTVSGQQALPYSIRFENFANASAPAQDVIVTDQLNVNTLDLPTVSLDQITFGSTRIYPPPGLSNYSTQVDLRPAKNLLVNVTVLLDPVTHVLTWYFNSIDPVTGTTPTNPTVGFLPPNVAPPEGEGSVLFTVMPKTGVTTVTNAATILFDDPPATNTPIWSNGLDDTPPASHVLPLAPTSNQPTIPVSWTADGSPADLRDFTIYVKEDTGPYRVWRLNTSATSDTLGPSSDHKLHDFFFYSVARDHLGNIEAAPPTPDATTHATTAVGQPNAPRLALEGARPNPAVGGKLIVAFSLPNAAPATLDLMDVAGRRLVRREVGSMGPGPHVIDLGREVRKSGIYFLRLAQGDRVLRARTAVIR